MSILIRGGWMGCAVALIGCGFQPSEGEWPAALMRMQVSGADYELVGEVKTALRRAGATLVTDGGARLQVNGVFSRTVRTTDRYGTAATYDHTLEVTYHLSPADEAPHSPQSFSVYGAMRHDAERPLAAAAEQRFLQDTLRREAAARLVTRLNPP